MNAIPATAEVLEELDVEEYARSGKHKPPAKRYRIRIDDERYIVDVPKMTGRQLLELSKHVPVERFAIYQKVHGDRKKIGLDEFADFTTPGIERFETIENCEQAG